jgi:hypothetical protein
VLPRDILFPTLFLLGAVDVVANGPDRPFQKGKICDCLIALCSAAWSQHGATRQRPFKLKLSSSPADLEFQLGKRRTRSIFRHTAPNANTVSGAQRC